ncbi:MAG: hypothetical protein JXB07_11635 [Anaerolineae bacterium]|nr:hypothetical protein [Anaerolineae bacterium]
MNYKIEVVPGEQIVQATLFKHYSFAVDDPVANNEVKVILDASDTPMFMIIDVTQLSLSLDDVVKSANSDTRGEQAIYRHPKLRGVLVVTQSHMVRLAVKGLTSVTFGNVNAKAFGSVEEAIDYARSQG